ncbi:zinc-dependent alcohol dehydrogenase family protein [Pectobacterium polaris]|uniref:zinc-dependent alcohol dehydrogenase family protein n=1 Tax=Pectobacterium polaris TaxID=2042057 RepID=UPI002B246E3F|nr:zinc-dependent alcohol dehydrogenase family protein [Pectobacterium polaris]
MTRVWRFHKLGGPDVLQLDTLTRPLIGADDIHFQVRAIGLNRSDLNFRRDEYIQKAVLPARFGYEAAGTVIACGSNVHHFRPGDDVFVLPPDDLSVQGTSADELVLPERYFVHKPANISFEQASAVWMSYLTAWGGVVHAAGIKKGDYVLITAASSSVGIAAIQLARQAGAIPIATVRDSQWKERLRENGAAHVIATDTEDLLTELTSITGPEGLSAAFDAVGGSQVMDIARALKKKGRLIIHGYLSSEPTPFPLRLAIRKSLTVQGYLFADILKSDTLSGQARQHILNGLVTSALIPLIDRSFPFTKMREAQEYMEGTSRLGKVVITV